jgi:hypothetical protein
MRRGYRCRHLTLTILKISWAREGLRVAMPKTGSRSVVVDGYFYRWRVRPSPTYEQGAYADPLTYSIQREDGGAVLLVVSDRPRPDNWLGRPGAVVTPVVVAEAIRRALAAGWRAGAEGSAFELAWVSDGEPGAAPDHQ